MTANKDVILRPNYVSQVKVEGFNTTVLIVTRNKLASAISVFYFITYCPGQGFSQHEPLDQVILEESYVNIEPGEVFQQRVTFTANSLLAKYKLTAQFLPMIQGIKASVRFADNSDLGEERMAFETMHSIIHLKKESKCPIV